VTSFLLVGAGSPINGGSAHGVDQIAPHPMRTHAEIIGDSAHLVPTSRPVADQRSRVR
jgi:hypothetical protein